jgi:hypothetical protein
MSNVASVITTTTNTVVDSANAAVSIGRWSNLAIIAFCSFLSVWEGGSHCYAGLCDPKNESRGCYTRSNNRSLCPSKRPTGILRASPRRIVLASLGT